MSNIAWSFAGRTVLVSGSSGGIGLATATLFADAGARVFGLSRSGNADQRHSDVVHLACDVTVDAELCAAVDRVVESAGAIDICIANAGVCLVEHYEETDPADWRKVIELNLLALMRTWQLVLPHMGKDGRGGRLIANSSAAGVRGEALIPAYSASKAAISGLIQALAVRYAGRGISVNAVAPGEIDTEMNRMARASVAQRSDQSAENVLRHLVSDIPAGRLGDAGEVASLIAFLASDEAAFVTGRTIVSDGGQLLI